jgi:hypothetical protein
VEIEWVEAWAFGFETWVEARVEASVDLLVEKVE